MDAAQGRRPARLPSLHEYANMELSAQDRTARSKHSRAIGKGETCIDCHKDVVNSLPDEP